MTGQNIATATGWSTDYDAGVPLQADPANIIRAFTEYHYGAGYNGSGTRTGMDYFLSQKAPLASPSFTGTIGINNSGAQLLLKNASGVTKAGIGTNNTLITGAATDDLEINSLGSKILFGISSIEKLRINASGVTIPSILTVSGSATFSSSVQFTADARGVTAPTYDNSTKLATTANVYNTSSALASSNAATTEIEIGPVYNLANAIELYQPIGNGTVVTQIGTAVTAVGTAAAVNVVSSLTNYVTKSRRIQYGTAAVAGVTAGIRNPAAQYSQDNGFLFYARFAPQSIRPASASRGFFGMWATATALTNVAITTLLNMYGIGWDAADTTYYWYNNDGAGTAVKTQAVDNFSAPITIRTDDLVELVIHAYNNLTIDMTLIVNNKVNGTSTAYKTLSIGTDDMPASNTLMTWHLAISNAAAAANYAMDINKVVVKAQDIRTTDLSSIYTGAIPYLYGQDG